MNLCIHIAFPLVGVDLRDPIVRVPVAQFQGEIVAMECGVVSAIYEGLRV